MSVIDTVFETMAKLRPDKGPDPLIYNEGFLGKPLHRVEGELKVKGAARFAAEFDVPGLLYAALVCSPIAKGRIVRMETENARRAAGVVDVITYENIPKMKAPPLVDIKDIQKGMAASDLPIMQDPSIQWDGQPI